MTFGNTKDSTLYGSLKIPIHAHGFPTSTYSPMDCLNIDFICLFPDKGYILVIVCTFTRWVELYATIDATAQSTAECLLQHFGRFGSPRQLRSCETFNRICLHLLLAVATWTQEDKQQVFFVY